MSQLAPIAAIFAGVTSIGTGVACLYFMKDHVNKHKLGDVFYKFDICSAYATERSARQYEYKVKTPTFTEMEKQYKESLMGNPDTKKSVDAVVKDYLRQHEITQKHVVIQRPEWGCRIESETFVTPDYLVLDIIPDNGNMHRVELE